MNTDVQKPKLASFHDMYVGGFKETLSRTDLAGSFFLAFAGIGGVGFILLALLFGLVFSGDTLNLALVSAAGLLGLVIYVVVLIAYMAAGAALLRCALNRHLGEKFWPNFRWTLKHLWPLMVVGLYIQLTTTVGYILLLIPGVVLSIYTSFSLFVYMSEGIKGLDALVRSIDLVRGSFWGSFGRVFLLAITSMLSLFLPLGLLAGVLSAIDPKLGVVAFVLIVIAYPVAIVWLIFGITKLFESLQARKPLAAYSAVAYARLRSLLFWIAMIGIPILMLWISVSFYMSLVDPTQSDSGLILDSE